MDTLTWLRILCAGAVGFVAWHSQMWAIPLSILAPCLATVQPNRTAAAAASWAYYAAASFPAVAVARAYWPSLSTGAVLIWLAASAILALPWILCWTRRQVLRPWNTTVAVALNAIPPLCIVGWASPLVSAGVLFPNSAWIGLCATLALPGLLLHNGTRGAALIMAGTASLVLNAQAKPLPPPRNWESETTHIHRPRAGNDLAEFNIEQHLQSVALSSRRAVLVFPEGAVRHWTAATDAFWEAALAGSGKTFFVGAAEPIPGSPQLHNSVIVVGDRRKTAVRQRIPVPGGMWNPLHPEGNFALDLFAPGTVDIGGQRAAILICYEQLLTWPMLRSALERPTVLVALSNEAWTTGTTIPRGQHACARAWARLFGLPLLSASNS